MKKLFALAALMMSVSVFAVEIEGKYEVVRPLFMRGYHAKACIADGGVYVGDGLCKWEKGGGSSVVISSTETNFELEISSVGTNGHTCDFSGKAALISDYHLVSKENGDEGKCEVNVFFTSVNTISVKTNGECSEYCGANMMLDEENLNRVK